MLSLHRAILLAALFALSAPLAAQPDKTKKAAAVRKDAHGDLLPAGVVARGGTARFRHTSTAIAYSLDGKWLASGGSDNTIRLFNANTGVEVKRFAGHQPRTYKPDFNPTSPLDMLVSAVGDGFVCSVAFSPDGKWLASGGWDDFIRIWDVSTGKEVRRIHAHFAMVTRVAFSPDGRTLVSRGGLDGTGKVWDHSTGTLLHKFTGLARINPWRFNHDSSLAISPDSKTVAFTAPKSIVLYNLGTGAELRRFDAHSYGIALAFSHDGKFLASGGVDPGKDVYTLRLWNPAAGKEIKRFELPKNEPPTYLAFAPGDSNKLAAVVAEDNMHIFDVKTGKAAVTLKHYWPSRLAWSPDGKALASAGNGPVIRRWEPTTGKELAEQDGHISPISSVALSKDGKWAVSAGGDVRLWDAATGKPKLKVKQSATTVAISPDGKQLAVAGRDRIVRLLDAEKGTVTKELKGHKHALASVVFSPDGKLLASGDLQATVKIWDVEEGKAVHTIENKAGTDALSLAFSPDGSTLACAGAWNDSSFLPKPGTTIKINGKEVKIGGGIIIQGLEMTRREGHFVLAWNTKTGKESRRFAGLKAKITDVAYSSDGKLLAAAARDGRVCIWDAQGGKLRLVIHANTTGKSGIAGLAFNKDDKALITAGHDGALRTWDVSTGEQLREYRNTDGAFTALAAGRDGKTVITGGSDTGVLTWDITLPEPPKNAGRGVITIR
jgi:WD40 repeat protein